MRAGESRRRDRRGSARPRAPRASRHRACACDTRSAIAPPSDDERALEPAAQALPPASAVVRVAVVHAARRDSRFTCMTPEEMLARLLYRDGLMLVIDKPAGLAGASRAEGRREPGGPFRRAALRPAARARAGAPARPRHLRLPGARPPPQGAGDCSASCSSRARSARPIGRWWKAARTPTKAASTLPLGKLDETRGWWMKPDPHGQPAVDDLEGDGARRRP